MDARKWLLGLCFFLGAWNARMMAASDNCATATAWALTSYTGCGADFFSVNLTGMTPSAETPLPGCGTYGAGKNDAWGRLTVPAGVTTLGVGMGMTNPCPVFGQNRPSVAFYRGSCGSLTLIDCFETPPPMNCGFINLNLAVCGFSGEELTGLTPGETIYVRIWEANDVAVTTQIAFTYFTSPPSNDICSNMIPLGNYACNFYATGGDMQALDDCGWNSTDNTTFYSFTVDGSTPQPVQITLDNVACVGGCNEIQLAIYDYNASCTGVGGSDLSSPANTTTYHGCASGTGNVTITATPNPLPQGDYILAVDGCSAGIVGASCVFGIPLGGTTQTAFCTFAFSGAVVLPIQVAEFSAAAAPGRQAVVNWITHTEEDVHHYEIERSSDGVDFYSIGKLSSSRKAFGDAYRFVDEHPELGVSSQWYRLRQVDFDGRSYLTTATEVQFEDMEAPLFQGISPNPVAAGESIHTEVFFSGRGKLALYDLQGRELWSTQMEGGLSAQTVQVPTTGLAPGMYWLKASREGQQEAKKLLIQ